MNMLRCFVFLFVGLILGEALYSTEIATRVSNSEILTLAQKFALGTDLPVLEESMLSDLDDEQRRLVLEFLQNSDKIHQLAEQKNESRLREKIHNRNFDIYFFGLVATTIGSLLWQNGLEDCYSTADNEWSPLCEYGVPLFAWAPSLYCGYSVAYSLAKKRQEVNSRWSIHTEIAKINQLQEKKIFENPMLPEQLLSTLRQYHTKCITSDIQK